MVHAVARRFACEELVRLRRADEQRRYLASQRSARIDPNPHQIEAVIFALQRIPKGGCILADEVGLGKTIEAGLTLSQMLAEGASRILLLTPKPLLGQWRDELLALFGIMAREGADEDNGFEGPGVFIAGREYAGSEAGAAAIGGSGKFDLCVIDEAHEIFAGIYRRYDRQGGLRDGSRYARTAARVKQALLGTPMLLLTATPIQNTLTEMWGLVQYVEPTGTLLGDLGTFRSVFCDGDDRRIRPGQDDELKRRLATVCQRTLRRQAQTFMARAFTQRTARLFEYSMSPDEAQLYDDVTEYLLDPKTLAFRGTHRRLLLIGFHRRMGSSVVALADSLQAVADRLRRKLEGTGETLSLFEADLDDGEDRPRRPESDDEEPEHPEPELLAEMKRVQVLADRARALPIDSKAEQLQAAVARALERPDGSGKVVIFTEALSTQTYIQRVLVDGGIVPPGAVTLFRGQNTGPQVAAALQRWEDEVASRMPKDARPSRSVAVRLALVHEFATKTSVFVATEAGAKGLNLQFCDTVINYDLPWNPQRIEQRIGRCHRYGQTRDVTVINFINRDNEAQRLTFDILSRKLELFGTVLDASDAVLHQASAPTSTSLVGALASDFEAQLADVYDKARSAKEIAAGMAALEARVGDAKDDYEATHARTAGLIETRFDATVRAAFKDIEEELPGALAALDAELEGVLIRYLDAVPIPYSQRRDDQGLTVDIEAHPNLPPALRDGVRVRVGDGTPEQGEPLHVGHAIVRAALEESRQATVGRQRVSIAAAGLDAPAAPGATGRITVVRMQALGFEPVTELLAVVVLDGVPQPVVGTRARAWVLAAIADADPDVRASLEALDDAAEEAIFVAGGDLEAREHQRFEETLAQVERSVDDRVLALRRMRQEVQARHTEALARRDAAVGPGPRTRAEQELAALETELEALDEQALRLLRRDDADYQTWRSRAYVRRYTPPSYERILDVEFVLV